MNPKSVLNVDSLSGQEKKAAKALLKHGYLDKEYALVNLKIRSLHEIIRRLRLKGWPIDTNDDPSRLYTLRRSLRQDIRLITSAINQAVAVGHIEAATQGAVNLLARLKSEEAGCP